MYAYQPAQTRLPVAVRCPGRDCRSPGWIRPGPSSRTGKPSCDQSSRVPCTWYCLPSTAASRLPLSPSSSKRRAVNSLSRLFYLGGNDLHRERQRASPVCNRQVFGRPPTMHSDMQLPSASHELAKALQQRYVTRRAV